MSNIKKIIGIVLAVVMAFSVASVAFAAEGDAYTVSFVAGATTLEPGQSTTIEVKVTADYPVTTISIPVFFDKTKLDVTAVPSTGMTVESIVEETNTNDVEKFYVGTSYDKATTGVRALVAYARQGDTLTTYNDTTVMTLTVTAKADASGTANVFCDEHTVKTSGNTTGTLYVGKNSSGTNTLDSDSEWIDDATITAATTTIAIGAAVLNTLVIKGDAPSTPYIDTANNCGYDAAIYGMDTLGWNDEITPEGAISDYLTTTLGDDYLEVITPECGVETTGTIINVLDQDGTTVLETYVFIYFGDINEDGLVDGDDDFLATYYGLNYSGIDNLEQLMAGDLDGDAWPTGDDGFVMGSYGLNYVGMPSQQEVADLVYAQTYELI